MKNKSSNRSARRGQSGSINLRMLLGLTLGLSGVALAILAGKDGALRRPSGPERYMPVPGSDTRGEASGLAELEQYWHNRLTFPTGRFDPAWVRAAAAQHARMATGVPAGQHLKLDLANPNALSTTNFTALGPQPERMTGCWVCFDYTTTVGRVHAIEIDPPTTFHGPLVGYNGRV